MELLKSIGQSFYNAWVPERRYLAYLSGLRMTLLISLFAVIIGIAIGIILAIIRVSSKHSSNPLLSVLNAFAKVYITVIRGTPMIVQAMIVFYGLRQAGFEIDPISAGILVTLLNTGAYMAETVRAGIKSIDAGQREGALALGMSPISAMFHIILPQAFKNIVPEMANMFLTNLKMTSVLNVIGVQELFLQAKTAGGTYYKYLESYLVIALIYLVLCFVFSRVFALIEKKTAVRKDYVLAVEYMENTQ